jgi:hypothetical protein
VIFRNFVAERHALSSLEIKYFPTTVLDRLCNIKGTEWAAFNETIKV